MRISASPHRLNKRPILLGSLLCAALLSSSQPARAFNLDDVAKLARQLASKPYVQDSPALPAELKSLNYDQYRDIRFKPERAIWRQDGLPFELMFFHQGLYQTHPVRINELPAEGSPAPFLFDPGNFDYGHNKLTPKSWKSVDYAGFRVHYPVNSATYKDEVLSFLGASYFRALGTQQQYGLSARGLAIDTVGGKGEEFPRFTEFWIEKPRPNSKKLLIYALLDSARIAGAYRFEVSPGENTVIEVQSQLYLRAPVSTLGIAPLTSMFLSGENQPRWGDFRPEVHDSDGLMIASGNGEWLWRPLINPKTPLTTSFAMKSLLGFGLMQRDQQYSSYEDPEARYERRPSAWIEPVGDWGPGRVELVQLPASTETDDNIVAYWVPQQLPIPGQALNLSYRIHWQGQQQQFPPSSWAMQSRLGEGFSRLSSNEYQYNVDFTGPALEELATQDSVKAIVSTNDNGVITERNVYPNPGNNTWRMTLRVKQLESTRPVELRAFLQHGKDTVSETWTNIIPPQ